MPRSGYTTIFTLNSLDKALNLETAGGAANRGATANFCQRRGFRAGSQSIVGAMLRNTGRGALLDTAAALASGQAAYSLS